MEQLLSARVAGEDAKLAALALKNEQATRQAVIDGFLNHLTQAGPQDVALFYYSGHGSQERTPQEFWSLEPDRLDETLVCYDSRQPGNYDLADKELSKLIAQVARNGAHMLVILDSCHSGSGTRAGGTEGVRRVPTDVRERPIETFIVTPDETAALAAGGNERELAAGDAKRAWIRLPRGKHVLMAACQDDEEAKETRLGGRPRGVFSYFLTQSLEHGDASLTYRDVFKRTQALVRTNAARQWPLIEATESQELDRPFLGGAIQPHPPYFTASFDQTDGWVIDGGAAHGIPLGVGVKATLLALFPFETPLSQLGKLRSAAGEARVTDCRPTRSKITIELRDGQQPDPQQTYRAVITATSLTLAAPLGVEIVGDPKGVELARAVLSETQSLFVREAADGARFRLIARADGYRIMRTADDRPLVVDVDGTEKNDAEQAISKLEHIARWQRIAELSNPATKLKPSDVQVEILLLPGPSAPSDAGTSVVDVASNGSELRLEYAYDQGKWVAPELMIRMKNNSGRELHCVLLDLTETYGVFTDLLPGGSMRLKPGEEAYAKNGDPIPATVPDNLWEAGLGEIKDLLKLIVSTEKCDATLFQMEELDMKFDKTRRLGGNEQKLEDWATCEVSVTTVRPLPSAPIPTADRQLDLAPQVTLLGHPDFKAQARLTTLPQASRSARLDAPDLPRFPRLLTDDPSVVRPLQFVANRSGEAGPSVLELTHVDSSTVASVTPEKPLVLKIAGSLVAEDEHVLPVGYDKEFYLPLGRAYRAVNEVEVAIERLPEPVVDSRSLTGSIRIFFQKVVSEKFGFEFAYPLLAIAESDGAEGVKYDTDPLEVRSRVAAASRVLLYVHGIIGDTRGMASSAYGSDVMAHPPLQFLSGRYDLVLTFDYENLKTSIEQNARLLKSRLAEAGLGEGHGKTFHIVAHSMGGLVSRWFIEREGGNQVVQRLVMLGTPNAGSPWSTIEDWAMKALSLGLNGLSAFVWPARALGGLVNAIEKIDVTLDQMNPQSEFLKTLAASPDPGVKYTVIAGNTSLIAQPEAEPHGRLARLLNRLKPRRALHEATALAFFGQPNDIAVSVTSIKNLPAGRSPEPKMIEVACDHITYFSTEAGLRALADTFQ
jgi:pimeloyl-ACP methyl ester carboxylesterase